MIKKVARANYNYFFQIIPLIIKCLLLLVVVCSSYGFYYTKCLTNHLMTPTLH